MLGSANIKKDRPKRNGTLQSIRLPARYPLRGHAHLTVQQSFLVGGGGGGGGEKNRGKKFGKFHVRF